MSANAAIVGAGIFGASLAHRLARDGWNVRLYERREPGHPLSASGDHSRLIRYAHGSDAWYTRSAWRARELWRELEAETGRELLLETGIAWFARDDGGWEAESERVLQAEGIPVERLEPEAGRELFPSFEPGDLRFILWEPQAGVLRAREATRATAAAAAQAGVEIVYGAVTPADLDADIVVWACGAWLPELFDVPIRVTKQDVLYFSADGWETPGVPAWVEYERAVYGLGNLDGAGVKVAPDLEGPEFDPEEDERVLSEESEPRARAYLAERFPALRDAPRAKYTVCQYALTPDTHFMLDRVGTHWIFGGGSGHGFKHGPALAEYAARVITGKEAPREQFRLGPRQRGPSLRTAGTT